MLRTAICLLLAILLILTGSCMENPSAVTQPTDAPVAEPPRQVSITVSAMGDFLMHMPLINSAHNPETGVYEFSRIFAPVKNLIAWADYSIANLETRLAGTERGYSGYPLFNCPADLATEMRQVGLDMFLTANNHSLDQGVAGVVATIDHLEAAGLDHIGTYRTQAERDEPFVRDIGGIRLGIMNYTESTNGLSVPKDKPYLVNLIDREAMVEEIAALWAAGADIIIACLHFGVEYSRHPSPEQINLVDFLFGVGVDIVLGSHPHVVQPTRTLTLDGKEKKQFVAYSLGNFISNQRWRYADSGLLVNLTITKDLDTGLTFLDQVELVPTWVHTYPANDRTHYRVLSVHDALLDYQNGTDPLLTPADYQQLQQVAEDLHPDFLVIREANEKEGDAVSLRH